MSMRSWPLAQIVIEKRRYAILRHLHDSPGRELSAEILKHGCRSQGIPSDDDEIAGALAWLEAQGLVVQDAAAPIRTARLAPAGHDVVRGHATVAGILVFGDAV